jgi:SAM-dependent methyltransferase
VIAVDLGVEQIDAARSKPIGRSADFRVADAQKLPFENGAFDVVASSLVINFIPDRPGALAEMRRVVRPGGVVAGYVWDLVAGMSPTSLLRFALSHIGADSPRVPGTEDSTRAALSALFAGCGLGDIATRAIDVTMSFADFGEFWRTQTPGYSPTGKVIAALSETDRKRLKEWLCAELPAAADGSIALSARANAIKARKGF